MTGYNRYRYNPWTDSFVAEEGIDRLTQPSDFTTVRMSDLENCREELKSLTEELSLYKKAYEILINEVAAERWTPDGKKYNYMNII